VNGVLENPLDTLVREIGEEVESKEAQKVLISHLNKDPSVYKVKDVDVNGERTKTYIYVIHITDGKEWGKVRPTRFTHDAGPAHVLSLGDLITLGKESFAFDDFWIFEEFSKSHFSEQYGNLRGSTDSHAHALPFSRYLPSSSFPLKRNSPPHPKEHIFGASQHRIGQRLENYFPVNSAYSFN
ncbi:hypothetical protein HYU13_01680, partial [Candidatus Woesearchaeota archaeon]|nr:hypothetical protein [Candidatus Woesearchaeota archaeon]